MLSRPPGFEYKNNELHCEHVPLRQLAGQYGTPLYVYSASAIRERYRIFDRSFRRVPHTICFSVKANSNLSILRLMGRMGAGFDIVSGGELERVRLAAKRAVRKVVFSGVGKTAEELKLALKADILLFNVESESELELLAACAAGLRKTARIALRVNPDVPAQTHPYISTGLQEHKFGVPISEARELYKRAAAHKSLKVAGVSLHIGSQITDVAPFGVAVQRATELIRQLAADGRQISFLDAGGGLGIPYAGTQPIDFENFVAGYAETVTGPLRQLGKLRPHLLLEPGRAIVGPAGALVTRFLYGKRNGKKNFNIVDAAMNDLLRPALYNAKHEIVPVSVNNVGDKIQSDVVGPVCETGDFLARDISLPAISPGDYLCILDTGAYGMVLASNYNTRPRAAEVLVEGKKVRLVRRRETLKDLLQPETPCL
jgi:diaminopimelate decarboxylase